jgi:hypothetical protein
MKMNPEKTRPKLQPGKKAVLAAVALFLLLYCGSYSVMSAKGHYKPLVFGLVRGNHGELISAPKVSMDPYYWIPFKMIDDKNQPTFRAMFYVPLIKLDNQFFHRSELADTGRYRVLGYFDPKTKTYRDVEPN